MSKRKNYKVVSEDLNLVLFIKGFKLEDSEEGLTVLNPPTVRFTDNSEITNEDLENMTKARDA